MPIARMHIARMYIAFSSNRQVCCHSSDCLRAMCYACKMHSRNIPRMVIRWIGFSRDTSITIFFLFANSNKRMSFGILKLVNNYFSNFEVLAIGWPLTWNTEGGLIMTLTILHLCSLSDLFSGGRSVTKQKQNGNRTLEPWITRSYFRATTTGLVSLDQVERILYRNQLLTKSQSNIILCCYFSLKINSLFQTLVGAFFKHSND